MSDTIFIAPKALDALHKLVEQKTAATAAQLNHATIFGMEIRPLPSWWPTGEQWHPDWRERLEPWPVAVEDEDVRQRVLGILAAITHLEP